MPSSTVLQVGKASGKRRGSLAQNARSPKAEPEPAVPWEVDESRSIRSGWIWRGFLMMSLVALGITIVLLQHGHKYRTFGILWGVITLGWFAISMWLWRKHSQYMRS